jgi:hypothetical protein
LIWTIVISAQIVRVLINFSILNNIYEPIIIIHLVYIYTILFKFYELK